MSMSVDVEEKHLTKFMIKTIQNIQRTPRTQQQQQKPNLKMGKGPIATSLQR